MFTDVLVKQSESGPIFCYRTKNTVYEEGISKGYFASFGWNGAGFTLNVLEDFPSYLKVDHFNNNAVFSIDVNGKTLNKGWNYVSHTIEPTDKGKVVAIKFVHKSEPIEAIVFTELDGTAILSRYVQYKNNGQSSVNISNVVVMGGALERIESKSEYKVNDDNFYSLGYFDKTYHMSEGEWGFHQVLPIKQSITSRYDSDRFRHPAIMLRNNVWGNIWFMQLAYSGGYSFDVDYKTNDINNVTTIEYQVKIVGDNPTYVLDSGKTFTSPVMHIGMVNEGFTSAVNEMHDHIRASVFTYPEPDFAVGGLFEGGMGPERTMDFKAIKHFADTMNAIGAETLIIDAGWYCPKGLASTEWSKRVGKWEYDETLYPEGIDAIRDYVHSKGLKFGMWAEIERAGEYSSIANEHPDWFIKKNLVEAIPIYLI